jgi:hypothetical protein
MKQILIFYKSLKVRLGKQPEMTALNTLVKAAFKNAHSDKKEQVVCVHSRLLL